MKFRPLTKEELDTFNKKSKCAGCGEMFLDFLIYSGGNCEKCEAKARDDSKKTAHLEHLRTLTIYQQLEKINEWIYDHDHETNPPYVTPPRLR